LYSDHIGNTYFRRPSLWENQLCTRNHNFNRLDDEIIAVLRYYSE